MDEILLFDIDDFLLAIQLRRNTS